MQMRLALFTTSYYDFLMKHYYRCTNTSVLYIYNDHFWYCTKADYELSTEVCIGRYKWS